MCVCVRALLTTAHLSKEGNNVELMNGRSHTHEVVEAEHPGWDRRRLAIPWTGNEFVSLIVILFVLTPHQSDYCGVDMNHF